MKRQLLHTPEGVRDIYNDECEKKLILQDELLKVQKQYGYHPIQTPTFEFFDTFGREIGTTPSKDLYKFFDREGNTLVLRPDITPSIARCAAMYFGEEKMPIRLCYMGNTFLNNSSYQGRLKESTQLGAELLGDSTVDADAEIIAMVIDCLKKAGYEKLIVTCNGKEAWDKIQEFEKAGTLDENVHCVITDIEMPQMDGHRLTKLIKSDDKLKHLPVIIFSSLVNEEMRRKGESLGADAQLTKPEIGSLVDAIDELLAKRNK